MTAPASAMTRFYSPQPSEQSHLLRKLVLLFLLGTALALGLVMLFRAKPGYPFWMQNVLATLSLAVVSALAARWVLRKRHFLVRFLAALASFVIGLYVLGLATGWKHGIGPLTFWPRTVDWEGVGQLGLGLYLCLLTLRAWHPRPAQILELAPGIEPELRDLRSASDLVRQKIALTRAVPIEHHAPAIAVNHHNRRAAAPTPSLRVRRSSRKRQQGMIKTIGVADLPVRPKPRRNRGRARVQFAVVEDHRCPFCLETVSRADPRGVVECEICHALHHKDCWDITGVCQVPHLNS